MHSVEILHLMALPMRQRSLRLKLRRSHGVKKIEERQGERNTVATTARALVLRTP